MNGATCIVSMLGAAGATQVFGVAGESVLSLLDAVRTDENARYTAMRHEQAAALAAGGYAQTRREPAVCLGHVGAGSTNLVNGIADAYKDSNPVIAVAADVETEKSGRDAWHELDQEGIFEPITDQQVRLDDVQRIPQQLRDALTKFNTGAPGPILITVPSDVAEADLPENAKRSVTSARRAVPAFSSDHDKVAPTEPEIGSVVNRFLGSERPVVLAGGGVLWSGASNALQSVVEYAEIPLVTTLNGRGCISERHDLSFGALGTFGRRSAKMVADDADFVLAVGTRLGDNETFGWSILEDAEIVQVDLGEAHLGRQYDLELPMLADATAFLERFDAALRTDAGGGTHPGWDLSPYRKAISDEIESVTDPNERDRTDTEAGLVNPHEVLRAVDAARNPTDVICSGAGQHSLWVNLLPIESPNTYCKSVGLGTMGFAFSAGIGAQVASDERTAFVLVGDGDFAMVCQELWTCVQESLPLVVVVLDDEQLSAIKNPQVRRHGEPAFGVEHTDADFARIARGFGATGIRVESSENVEKAVEEAIATEGPAVVDVKIDPTIQAPSFFYEHQ